MIGGNFVAKSVSGRFIVVVGLCLIVLTGVLPNFMPFLQAQKVVVQTLQTQTLPNLLPLQGQLQPVRSISHYPAVAGEVQSIYVRSGQNVVKGAKLFSVLPSTLQGKTFRSNIVYARISGVVSHLRIQPQQSVATNEVALQIIDQTKFLLNTNISDIDFPAIDTDTEFDIYLDGDRQNLEPDNLLSGHLWQRDFIPNNQGLFAISIAFQPNESLYAGKFVIASAKLSFETGLFVPVSAIVRHYGKEYLWLLDKQRTVSLQEIQLNVRRNDSWLIKDGLQNGTRYILGLNDGLQNGTRYIGGLNGVNLKEGQQLAAEDIEEILPLGAEQEADREAKEGHDSQDTEVTQ